LITPSDTADGLIHLRADLTDGPNIQLAQIMIIPHLSYDPPENPERADIDIDAAANAPMGVATSWSQARDEATKLSAGFDYAVANADCWRDATGSAWFGSEPGIEITCPVGFEGTAYYHFHDWNSAGRSAHIYFEGSDIGPLGDHSGDGVWVSFTVNASDTADGRIHLQAQLTSGPNVMIARIVLIPPVEIITYAVWVEDNNLTGANALSTTDIEPDGMDNLLEYALGGNPTNDDSAAFMPVFGIMNIGGSNVIDYVYNRRLDAAILGLTYGLNQSMNLQSNWKYVGTAYETDSSTIDLYFESVSNSIPVATDKGFIQLKIEGDF